MRAQFNISFLQVFFLLCLTLIHFTTASPFQRRAMASPSNFGNPFNSFWPSGTTSNQQDTSSNDAYPTDDQQEEPATTPYSDVPTNGPLNPFHKVPINSNHQGPKFEHSGDQNQGTYGDPDEWLAAHNAIRVTYHVKNLTWSNQLAHAAKMATNTCVWEHTKQNTYGENIAANQVSPHQVVSDWVNAPNEKDSYVPGGSGYSHFTQVIWKGSTQVGCALTSCNSMEGLSDSPMSFWACEYFPAGNVLGEFKFNVLARKGGRPL